jgi:competence protein ComGC
MGGTGRKEGKAKMRIFFHGNDKGNAVLLSLVLIMVLSLLFLTLVPRITAIRRFSYTYKESVLNEIKKSNREIMERYDLY